MALSWKATFDRSALAPSAREAWELPNSAVVQLNCVAMANYLPLVEGIIECLKPRRICEIGSAEGHSTRVLMTLTAQLGAELDVVDPTISGLPGSGAKVAVQLYRERSLDYLHRGRPSEVYFIDGDHNYFTVRNELEAILTADRGGRGWCAFLHDVGWPNSRRDMYYDLHAVSDHVDAEDNVCLSPFSSVPGQEGLLYEVAVAASEGGERNGVLTAVEDALAASPHLSFASIPSLYGFGILWDPRTLTAHQQEVFRDTVATLIRIRPFLAALEFNRVLLLQKIGEGATAYARLRKRVAMLEHKTRELEAASTNGDPTAHAPAPEADPDGAGPPPGDGEAKAESTG